MTLDDYPDVGRVSQVAEVLDCNEKTAYELIKDGHLSAIRLGRSIRITKQALLRFLEIDPNDETIGGD